MQQQERIANNLILGSLPEQELEVLRPHLRLMQVKSHQILVEPYELIEHVYFPIDCMISIVTILDDGLTIESATIGSEGMSGLSVFHGIEVSSSQAIVQMEGETARLRSSFLRENLHVLPGLKFGLGLYADALISMLAQSGACNGLHTVEQRFARWLLTIQDRVGRDEFTITQDFLGQMLGSHRPTVTLAAGVLQRAGLINYRHGHVVINDRESLIEVACECYQIIRDLYQRTYKHAGLAGQPSATPSD